MSLPTVGWREVLKALSKRGFYVKRERGGHICLTNGRDARTTVPKEKQIKKGTLLAIIADCNMTKQEFLDLL